MPREIHTRAELVEHLATRRELVDIVVHGVDLAGHGDLVTGIDCTGTMFLGCHLDTDTLACVIGAGATVFPRLSGIPFDPYRPVLYSQGELLEGWRPGRAGSFEADALDSVIHRWASRHQRGSHLPVMDALARRLHDHAIDDALRDHLAAHPDVVAVMGGHGLRRDDPAYAEIARLGRVLAREGWLVATGGGPGAMEAANLGAWLREASTDGLPSALEILARAPRFEDADPYLAAGQAVLDRNPTGGESLAVPTWFYGHEPTNQFATHVAKYFANSIREDGLLAIANRGVIFAPGSAGTVQEIFQDATQNHYGVFGVVSPMVLLGRDFWTRTLPASPLLHRLARDRPYGELVGVADTVDDAVRFLRAHPPLPARGTP